MIFEEIGASQVDKNLQCLKIQIDSKIYLIGLQDLEQAIKDNRVIGVFRMKHPSNKKLQKAEKNEPKS